MARSAPSAAGAQQHAPQAASRSRWLRRAGSPRRAQAAQTSPPDAFAQITAQARRRAACDARPRRAPQLSRPERRPGCVRGSGRGERSWAGPPRAAVGTIARATRSEPRAPRSSCRPAPGGGAPRAAAMRPPHSGFVATIDGASVMPAERARMLARGMFFAGFLMLPWCACIARARCLPGLSLVSDTPPFRHVAFVKALAGQHLALLAARAPRRGSHRRPHHLPLCAPAQPLPGTSARR